MADVSGKGRTSAQGRICCVLCRVRISLGLKPLSMDNNADIKRKEFDARQKVLAEQEQDAQAAALAERVQK